MAFTTHCKITSSIKLEGADKAKGEGGWGHVTYQLYPWRLYTSPKPLGSAVWMR